MENKKYVLIKCILRTPRDRSVNVFFLDPKTTRERIFF